MATPTVTKRIPYGMTLRLGYISMGFAHASDRSSPRKVGAESVQDHSWHDVLRRSWLARVGPRRERRHRACKIRVSTPFRQHTSN
jgi:hypothetical protein